MFAASGLPVAERTSEATFIGQVDAARGLAQRVQFQSCHRAVGVSAWQVAACCTLLLLHFFFFAASSFDTNNQKI